MQQPLQLGQLFVRQAVGCKGSQFDEGVVFNSI